MILVAGVSALEAVGAEMIFEPSFRMSRMATALGWLVGRMGVV